MAISSSIYMSDTTGQSWAGQSWVDTQLDLTHARRLEAERLRQLRDAQLGLLQESLYRAGNINAAVSGVGSVASLSGGSTTCDSNVFNGLSLQDQRANELYKRESRTLANATLGYVQPASQNVLLLLCPLS